LDWVDTAHICSYNREVKGDYSLQYNKNMSSMPRGAMRRIRENRYA
jgi:hypothetical protein